MGDELLLEGRILESTRDRAKQEVVIDLIAEGFGNPRDGHYYSRSLLESSASIFDGALQYVDHLDSDAARKLNGLPRSVRDLGGRILEAAYLAPGETHPSLGTNDRTNKEGQPVAVIRGRSKVAQPWLWSMVEADPDLLGVSIHAGGNSKAGQVEGRQAKIVEAITRVGSVDWVTQAGAGGKVVGLIEAQIEAEVTDPPTPDPQPESGDPPTAEASTTESVSTPPESAPEAPAPVEAPPATKDEPPTETATLTVEHIETLIDAIGDKSEMLVGAERKLDLEPTEGNTLPKAVTEAWAIWCAYVAQDPDGARSLISEWGDAPEDAETLTEEDEPVDNELETRAIELAQERLEEAVRIATEGLREHYEAKLAEAQTEYEAKLTEQQAGFDKSLAQRDQRVVAAQMIEQAGFKQPTERALKEQFFDAYYEAEGDTSADDVLRREVTKAISDRKQELAAYRERRVTGVPETDSSLAEAGVTPGVRAKKAPLDQEIDEQLGIAES